MTVSQEIDRAGVGSKRQRRSAVIGSSVGTIIEWYDFTLYGLAAALVFAPQFFGGSGVAGTLGAFATFAVGFFARPFGGLILAHFGDRLGRKGTLLTTLLIMGVSTTLIGLLPTYDQIGLWAPALLIVLRLFQGAGAGAEFAGAMTMAGESAHSRNRAYVAGFPGASVYVGMALATATYAVLTAVMTPEAFQAWGWRTAFLASVLIVGVALYFRLRVEETQAFEAAEESGEVASTGVPVVEAVRTHWRFLIPAMGLFVFTLPWVYVVQAFSVSYTTKNLGVNSTATLMGLLAAMILTVPATLAAGKLADRIGRKPLLMAAAIFGVVFAFPMFMLYQTKNSILVAIGLILGLAVIQGATIGVSAAMVAEIFPTRMRWSGIALSRELPAALAGGTAPLVATWLVSVGGGVPWLVSGYLVVLSLVGVLGVWFLPETLVKDEVSLSGHDSESESGSEVAVAR